MRILIRFTALLITFFCILLISSLLNLYLIDDIPIIPSIQTPNSFEFDNNINNKSRKGKPHALYKYMTNSRETLYFRYQSYGDYVDGRWEEAPIYNEINGIEKEDFDASNNVVIIPLVKTEHALTMYDANDFLMNNDVYYDTDEPRYSYKIATEGPLELGVVDYSKNYINHLNENYTKRPLDIQLYFERMQSFNYRKDIDACLTYLKAQLSYSENYWVKETNDPIVHFLTQSCRGVCEHFASAAVLMLRTFGFYARYVVGFKVTPTQNINTITTSDVHAWIEVFDYARGWVMYDPTPDFSYDDSVLGADLINKTINIRPADMYRQYMEGDNVFQEEEAFLEGFDQLADMGYTYEVDYAVENININEDKYLDIGLHKVYIENFKLFSPTGIDVTDDWSINCHPGRFIVFALIRASSGVNKSLYEYNGNLINHPYEIKVIGEISNNITFESNQINTGFKEAGIYNLDFDVHFYDNETHELMDQYFATIYQYGLVEIAKRWIKIVTGSYSKVYDGEVVTCEEYELLGDLCADDKVVVNFYVRPIYVGEYLNTAVAKIYDSNDNDVTHNYTIEYENGWINILESEDNG